MNPMTHYFALAMLAASTCLAAGPAAKAPPSEKSVSVRGYVKKPGKYLVEKGETLLSAINRSGREDATKDLKVIVIRKIDDTLTQEISFSSLKALREHPDADVPILHNDAIVVAPVTAK